MKTAVDCLKTLAQYTKVALARKLAVLMHRIWLEGTTFDWQHGTKTPAR
jgi:hypothetical protein